MEKKNRQQEDGIVRYIRRMNETKSTPELNTQYDLAYKNLMNEYIKNYLRLKDLEK